MIWLFAFSVLLVCSGATADPTRPVTLTPSKVVVPYGGSILVNCSATSEIKGIGWESTYGGTGLQKANFSILKIDQVEDWVIEPTCYINDLKGGQYEEELPVTVFKRPDNVTISPPSNETNPMYAFIIYAFTCRVLQVAPVSHLIVNWYKEDSIVKTEIFDDNRPEPLNIASNYEVMVLKEDNGKKIWCEAKLKFDSIEIPPMKSQPQEMIIFYPPTFDNPADETVELRAGQVSVLNCTAKGNPAPVYSWVVPDLFLEMAKDENFTDAVLTSTSLLHGNYSCKSSNPTGKITKYFYVVEAKEDRTTFGILIGVFASLGVLLMIAGPFIVTSNGSFSLNKGSVI